MASHYRRRGEMEFEPAKRRSLHSSSNGPRPLKMDEKGNPVKPKIIDQIFTVIDDLVDGKMICGAGGGGFLQVVLKKGVTKDDLRARLNEVFQDSGVDVWECAFV